MNRSNYTQNQALDEIAKEAEARLAAKRAARMEAREMRKREITKQNSFTNLPNLPPNNCCNGVTNTINPNTLNPPTIESYHEEHSSSSITEPYYDACNHDSQISPLRQCHDIPRISIISEKADSNGSIYYDNDRSLHENNSPNGYHTSMAGNLNTTNSYGNRQQDETEDSYNEEDQYSNRTGDISFTNNVVPSNERLSGKFMELDDPDIIQKFKMLETKYNEAIVANAQLQNEVETSKYQIENYKDDMDDLELKNDQMNREHKREHNELLVLRKNFESVSTELKRAKEQIANRDQLLMDSNMMIIDVSDENSTKDIYENGDGDSYDGIKRQFISPYRSNMKFPLPPPSSPKYVQSNDVPDKSCEQFLQPQSSTTHPYHLPSQVLLTQRTLEILREFIKFQEATSCADSLDSALHKLLTSQKGLNDRIIDLENQLHNENTKQFEVNTQNGLPATHVSNGENSNGSHMTNFSKLPPSLTDKLQSQDAIDLLTRKLSTSSLNSNASSQHKETQTPENEKETRRKLLEYEYKIQRFEQELTTMTANLERAEANSERFKVALENAEASEGKTRSDNRSLKRELREAKQTVEELEIKIGHLERRLEKLRLSRINAAVTEIS